VARTLKQPLATNPRAKMAGFHDGFVKLFTSPGTGVMLGGVIVAPRASELILAVSVAMEQRLTAEQLATTFAVYPSLSGSITEAARKLMEFTPDSLLFWAERSVLLAPPTCASPRRTAHRSPRMTCRLSWPRGRTRAWPGRSAARAMPSPP